MFDISFDFVTCFAVDHHCCSFVVFVNYTAGPAYSNVLYMSLDMPARLDSSNLQIRLNPAFRKYAVKISHNMQYCAGATYELIELRLKNRF